MSLAAVIFDVDGTLAETEETHRAAFNAAFADAGLGWHWDRTLYGDLLRVAGGKERLRHFMETHLDGHFPSEEIANRTASLHASKTHHYNAMVRTGRLALRPGIEALIRALHAEGLRMAIATTTSLPNIETLLTATLGETSIAWFAAICGGDSVPAKKPAPDIYEAVMAQLNLAPDACLAIEDSRNGLLSAVAAGIPVIATRAVYTQGDILDEAIRILPSLDTLGSTGEEILSELRRLHGMGTRPKAAV